MSLSLLLVGHTKEKYFKDSENEYLKRLSKFTSIKIKIIPQAKNETNGILVMSAEEKSITAFLKPTDYLVLLDEKGIQAKNSVDFSAMLNNVMNHHTSIVFAIGGSFGFSPKIKERANELWSLSNLTMPHHLVRTVFLEQMYRAFTILNGGKYHNA